MSCPREFSLRLLVELFQWKQLHVCFKFPYFLSNHDFIIWIHSWMLEPRFNFCQSVLWISRSFLTACFVVSAFCSFMNNSGEKNKARIIAIWKRKKKKRQVYWKRNSLGCSFSELFQWWSTLMTVVSKWGHCDVSALACNPAHAW